MIDYRYTPPMLAKNGDLSYLNLNTYQLEVKYDGMRCMAAITDDGNGVVLISRTLKDVTRSFPDVILQLSGLPPNTLLDGEIVCEQGFQALQTRFQRQEDIAKACVATPAKFIAFDVLQSDNDLYLDQTLYHRRVCLEVLHRHYGLCISRVIDPTEAIEILSDGKTEGIMAKLRISYYYPGYRSGDWRKIKPVQSLEVVIGGCTWGTGKRDSTFGALLVGVPKDDSPNHMLWYQGNIGTGFTDEILSYMHGRMKEISTLENVFMDVVKFNIPVQFFCDTHPSRALRCIAKYQELTKDGQLRFPVFGGLV